MSGRAGSAVTSEVPARVSASHGVSMQATFSLQPRDYAEIRPHALRLKRNIRMEHNVPRGLALTWETLGIAETAALWRPGALSMSEATPSALDVDRDMLSDSVARPASVASNRPDGRAAPTVQVTQAGRAVSVSFASAEASKSGRTGSFHHLKSMNVVAARTALPERLHMPAFSGPGTVPALAAVAQWASQRTQPVVQFVTLC
jgi:hypothetical protein